MTLTVAPVTGYFPLADGGRLFAKEVHFELSSEGLDTIDNATIPVRKIVVPLDDEGRFSTTLWPNSRGASDSYYRVSLVSDPTDDQNGWRRDMGRLQVPEMGGDVSDLLSVGHRKLPGVVVSVVPQGDYHQVISASETAKTEADRSWAQAELAEISATDAVGAADISRRWAAEAQDTEVEPGRFSALHYQMRTEQILLDVERSLDDARLETATRFTSIARLFEAARSGLLNAFPAGSVFSASGEGFAYIKEDAASAKIDIDFTAQGGCALQVMPRNGVISLSAFDPQLNAKLALLQAVRAMNRTGHRLDIDVPISVNYSTFSDIPELADGAHIVFNAAITMETFGVPVIWHQNKGANGTVTLERPKFLYSGIAPKIRPKIMLEFYGKTWTAAAPYSNRDQSALVFFRGSVVRIIGDFEARATDFSAPERMIPRAIAVLRGPNGQAGNLYGGDFHFDGILFGIIATGFDDFWIGNVYSDRWSQLHTVEYSWEAPGHVWYFTPDDTGEYNISIGNCYDSGREVGVPYVTAATSYKCTSRASTFQSGYLFSRRSQGIADLEVASCKIAGGYWDGSRFANSQLGTGKVARFADFSQGGSVSVDFGTWFFRCPEDYNNYVQIDATLATGHFIFDTPGTAMQSPFVLGVMNRCNLDISLLMSKVQQSPAPVAVRVDGGGSMNRFNIRTDSPQWNAIRAITREPAVSQGNLVEIHDMATGSRRRIANYYEFADVFFSERVKVPVGSSVATNASIPRGANLRSLSTRVVVALDTTQQLTGYSVGETGDVSKFGTTGVAVNNGTDDQDWERDASGWRASPLKVLLSARGGSFSGAGSIQVSGYYSLGKRNHEFV